MAAPPQQLRVLVIDDDSIMRELLPALLAVEGHAVEAVESGESALHALRTAESPDVVLSDVQLPGLSGAALATQLRTAAPSATLLAMSGSQPTAEVLGAFDGFLLKPFTPSDFSAAVTAAHQTGQAAVAQPVAPGNPDEHPALDETTYGRLAQSLKPGALAELYSLTLQDVSSRLALMEEARAAGDLEAFRREAHALKGGCSMVGAAELAGLAAQAEIMGGSHPDTATSGVFALAEERLGRILAARFGWIV